jgi:hypothetical protein
MRCIDHCLLGNGQYRGMHKIVVTLSKCPCSLGEASDDRVHGLLGGLDVLVLARVGNQQPLRVAFVHVVHLLAFRLPAWMLHKHARMTWMRSMA